MPTHGFGTKFSWNDVEVASLTDIGGVDLSAESLEVTTHDTTDRYKEFIAGLVDAGEVPIGGYFDPADTTGQQAMLSDISAGTSRTAIITFPASTKATWTFTAFVTKLSIGKTPINGAIPFSASVKISGKPTFAIATT